MRVKTTLALGAIVLSLVVAEGTRAQTTLDFPHLAYGAQSNGNWKLNYYFTNSTPATNNTGTLRFFSQNGTLNSLGACVVTQPNGVTQHLNPCDSITFNFPPQLFSSVKLTIQGESGVPLQVGWAQATFNSPVVGAEEFVFSSDGSNLPQLSPYTRVGVLPTRPFQSFGTFTTPNSGFALAAPKGPVNFRIAVFDSSGNQVAQNTTLSLGANQHTAQLLTQLVPGLPPGFQVGYITITGDQPFIALGFDFASDSVGVDLATVTHPLLGNSFNGTFSQTNGQAGNFTLSSLAFWAPDRFTCQATFTPSGGPSTAIPCSGSTSVDGNGIVHLTIVSDETTFGKSLNGSLSVDGTTLSGLLVDASNNPTGIFTTTLSIATFPGHFLVKNSGLYTQFERRGWPSEYWSGQVIQSWTQFDSVVGSTVSQEVSLQLDKMKAMGVNTITFELRTADPTTTFTFVPPNCNINPVLGFQFPQPTATELANLPLFFDMVQSKGMKVWLRLVNTHMEQQPPTNSQTWLGSIFGTIGKHPALDLILFEGDAHLEPGPNGTTTCGIPAEPPLWLGPGSVPATYVQWAINFALSQGLPSQKLSAEAVVGSYFLESNPPAGSNATNGHLWSPIAVEKTIFDNLSIPANQRTYAVSFYEHRKCSDAQSLPCTDLDPHDWADQTLQYVTSVTGSGPRIVAPEMGDLPPVDQVNWNTQHALESLVFLLQKYAIDGGAFWRWTSFMNSEDSDPTLATPVKQRGVNFVYNPVQKEVVDMGGLHVPIVPNGSFEGAVAGNGVPVNWTASGNGTVSQYLLTQEPGQPEVPARGTHAMRMVTGSGQNDSLTATSVMIPVVPSTLFTTTSNLRFSWTGDPNPAGPPASRPQVFITVLYFRQNGTPSAIHTQDTFAYFQENSTTGFATFPVQYTTPGDATFVEIQFGAARNGLPTQITLDVDNVR